MRPDVRRIILAGLATVVSVLCGVLATGCRPSCPPKTLADIEARYSLAVLKDCKGYGSLAECPSAPELKAQRKLDEEAASCR